MDFLVDYFTDTDNTDITAHSPSVGGDWLYHPASAPPTLEIVGNKLVASHTNADTVRIYNDVAPSTRDYIVRATHEFGFNTNYSIGCRTTTTGDGVFLEYRSSGIAGIFVYHAGVRVRYTEVATGRLLEGALELHINGAEAVGFMQDTTTGLWRAGGIWVSTKTPAFSLNHANINSLTAPGHPALTVAGPADFFSFHASYFPTPGTPAAAETALQLNSGAVGYNSIIQRSLTSTLDLSSSGSGLVYVDDKVPNSNTLELVDDVSIQHLIDDRKVPTHTLELESAVFSPSHPSMENVLELVSKVTLNFLTTMHPASHMPLGQVALGSLGVPWVPVKASNQLELKQLMGRERPASAGNYLAITSQGQGSLEVRSTLELTSFVAGGIERPSTSTLTLTQYASATGSAFNRIPSHSLDLVSAANGYNANDKCARRRGIRRGPQVKAQLTLRSLDGLHQVVLRNPEQDNIRRVAFDRVVRETRGGELTVFRPSAWPTLQTLAFTIVSTKSATLESLQDFFLDTLGEEVQLVDWLGEEWIGVVTRPDESFVEDREGLWTFGFEFQGHKTDNHSSNQNLQLTSFASAVIE